MPNWCKNKLYIVGDDAQRTEVVAFIDGGDDQKFDFSRVVAPPSTPEYSAVASSTEHICGCKSEYVGESPDGSWQINGKVLVGNNCPDHNAPALIDSPDNWYNWNVKHWGTKWNANDIAIAYDSGSVEFETAWSPPEPVVQALAQRFPNVTFIHDYVEQGIGYAGRKVYNAPETDDQRNRFALLVCGADTSSDEWYGFSYDQEILPPQMLLTECEVDSSKDGSLVFWSIAKGLFPAGGWGG
jgi:hypothetical protein